MRHHILMYCQHLLGVGHLYRFARLAAACVQSGFKVTVVAGGESVGQSLFEGCHWVQLPPIKVPDASFSELVTADGQSVSANYWQQRQHVLRETIKQTLPDVFLVEMYPFGRRAFRHELTPILAELKAGDACKVMCSLRDILVDKFVRDPQRQDWVVDQLQQYFDAVLVHGDENFIALQETFPAAERVSSQLYYTGYVGPEHDSQVSVAPQRQVVVSAGSGAVAEQMMMDLLAARPYSSVASWSWRFLLGPRSSHRLQQALAEADKEAGLGDIQVEGLRDDFVSLLAASGLSISQAGYNTVMDVLVAQCPALLLPFSNADETEQLLRAQRLAAAGYCHYAQPEQLSPQRLAQCIDNAVSLNPKSLPSPIKLGGQWQTVNFIKRWLNE
ncbi:glycosyltransferase family protein [Zooshikella ganghwensis]|uniref:glycosyltransferase family protein n=1 Tax=Zooshikella ganghwensis TaxID=202772 RepID=UPI00041DA510|nr:glycosyltransferase [Zooshikella ganghwensis]